MPEARIILAQAVTYVACAPKSNASYLSIDLALDFVKNHPTYTVPAHLQDKHYKGAEELGHGLGYLYAHDYENHYVNQQYLPQEMLNQVFYEPTTIGYEKNIKEYMGNIRKGEER